MCNAKQQSLQSWENLETPNGAWSRHDPEGDATASSPGTGLMLGVAAQPVEPRQQPHSLQTRTLPKSKAKEVKYYLHEYPWKDNAHLSRTWQICVFPRSDCWVTLSLNTHLSAELWSLWWLHFSSVFFDILLSFKLFLSTYAKHNCYCVFKRLAMDG